MNTAYNTSKEHKEQTRSTRSTQYEEEHEYRLNYKRRAQGTDKEHKEQTRSTSGALSTRSTRSGVVGEMAFTCVFETAKELGTVLRRSPRLGPGPGVMSLSKHPLSV